MCKTLDVQQTIRRRACAGLRSGEDAERGGRFYRCVACVVVIQASSGNCRPDRAVLESLLRSCRGLPCRDSCRHSSSGHRHYAAKQKPWQRRIPGGRGSRDPLSLLQKHGGNPGHTPQAGSATERTPAPGRVASSLHHDLFYCHYSYCCFGPLKAGSVYQCDMWHNRDYYATCLDIDQQYTGSVTRKTSHNSGVQHQLASPVLRLCNSSRIFASIIR